MKILLVDDCVQITNILMELLPEFLPEASFCSAPNALVSIEMVKNCSFDIIISDVNMPIMNGVAMTREIRKFSSIPVILLSALADELDKSMLKSLGIHKAISKPCCVESISVEILNAIKERQRTRDVQGLEKDRE